MAKFYIITGATIRNKPVTFKKHFTSRTAAINAYFSKYERNPWFSKGLQVEDEIVKGTKHDIEYVCSPVGNRFTVSRVTF